MSIGAWVTAGIISIKYKLNETKRLIDTIASNNGYGQLFANFLLYPKSRGAIASKKQNICIIIYEAKTIEVSIISMQ